MSQRHFFASSADLLGVFLRVESRDRFVFTLTGLFTTPQLQMFETGANLPTLHLPAEAQSSSCPTYLITLASSAINVRAVPQIRGGMRYAVDQLENPDSVTLTHGGLHASNVLISGRLATVSTSRTAKRIQSVFANAIASEFSRVQAFWVGPEAYRMLQEGCRLTFNVTASPEYDLERPPASA